MFCNKPKNVNKNVPGKKNRKRKRKSTHSESDKKPRPQQGGLNLSLAMSTWAQNYTAAATWQLKHQVAYWKSRAMTLQYENKILHDIIRDDHFKQSGNNSTTNAQASSESSESEEELEKSRVEEEEEEEEAEDDNFEVSEEWIEFLKQNVKYREAVRREREELKAKLEAEEKQNLEEERLETSEERQARMTELYGVNWERVLALETSLLCDFINECDKEQPKYWPNVPFNFASC